MSRPTKFPRWADVGGLVTEPTEAKKNVGWLTSEKPAAQFFNWLFNLIYLWFSYLDSGINQVFGDGQDGDATLDGVATVAWASLSGSVYTLTRDVHANNLTINAGIELKTAGYRVYVRDTLTTGSGGIVTANANGSVSGTVAAGSVGGTGGVNNGNNGGTISGGSLGGTGGHGGIASGHLAGVAGAANQLTVIQGSPPILSAATMGYSIGGGAINTIAGGSGGGGGAGSGSTLGGDGGAGGAVLCVCARTLALNAASNLQAHGGAGANGAASGNTGGGGGGGGGVLLLMYYNKNGASFTAGVNCAGGAAGAGHGSGSGGTAGSPGTVVEMALS